MKNDILYFVLGIIRGKYVVFIVIGLHLKERFMVYYFFIIVQKKNLSI